MGTTARQEKSSSERAPREKRHFSAQEKTQAVLSIWTERRKPTEICKEMKIEWALLRNWEHRALEGMMEALEPKRRAEEAMGPKLGSKLQSLLDRSLARRLGRLSKLERRLSKIQEAKPQKE